MVDFCAVGDAIVRLVMFAKCTSAKTEEAGASTTPALSFVNQLYTLELWCMVSR